MIRHAAHRHRKEHSVLIAGARAVAWVVRDRADDRLVSVAQYVVWAVALVVLFVLAGV